LSFVLVTLSLSKGDVNLTRARKAPRRRQRFVAGPHRCTSPLLRGRTPMRNRTQVTAILTLASVVSMAGCSAGVGSLNAPATGQSAPVAGLSAPGWIHENGVLYHTPHYMVTSNHARQAKPPAILLTYNNGPVLVSPKMYVIFWGYKTYGDADKVKKLLVKYAKALGGSELN